MIDEIQEFKLDLIHNGYLISEARGRDEEGNVGYTFTLSIVSDDGLVFNSTILVDRYSFTRPHAYIIRMAEARNMIETAIIKRNEADTDKCKHDVTTSRKGHLVCTKCRAGNLGTGKTFLTNN